MSEPLPSDLLSKLRHVSNECLRTDYGYSHYQAFKAELNAERVLALVECVELLDSVIEAQSTPATQAEWLHKRKAVLKKLEAL